MSTEKNSLLIAGVLGILLTAGLLYAIYKQMQPLDDLSGNIAAPTKSQATTQQSKPTTSTTKTATTQTKPAQSITNATAQPVNAVAKQQTTDKTLQAPKPEKIGQAGIDEKKASGLPDISELVSAEEFAKLTDEEKQQYENILQSYQAVRDEVVRLNQERQRLNNRMEQMSEKNSLMEKELEGVRQAHQQ